MSVVRIFTPKNRLAAFVGGPNDRNLASLARDADLNVAGMRDALLHSVCEQQAIIARLVALPEEEIFAQCEALDRAALAICELAAAAGLAAVGEVARGLHALLQALTQKGVWHTEALRLHAHALAILQSDAKPSTLEADRFIGWLAAMRAWLGVPE